MKKLLTIAALVATAPFVAVASNDAWDSIRAELYGDQPLLSGARIIDIDAPYRTYEDSRTELGAIVTAPAGAEIKKVTVVLDENPAPVSAVFNFETPLSTFYFDITMRINGPTPLHVIAEAVDGRLFMSETFVKTSGQGACSAPPGTNVEEALATLGEMQVELVGRAPLKGSDALTSALNRMNVDIKHPSHSGMQMDQISLLFLPMRYVENVDIELDGSGYVGLTGSISLSENPRVGISVPSKALSVGVTMTDTDGTVTRIQKNLSGF